jgi:hypothetical protein
MEIRPTPTPYFLSEVDGVLRIRAIENDGSIVYPARVNGDVSDPVEGPRTRMTAKFILAACNSYRANTAEIQRLRTVLRSIASAHCLYAVLGKQATDEAGNIILCTCPGCAARSALEAHHA